MAKSSSKQKAKQRSGKGGAARETDSVALISDGFDRKVAATPDIQSWIIRGANKQPKSAHSKDALALCCLIRALSRGWQHGAFQECNVWQDLVTGKLKDHRVKRGLNGRVVATSIWWQLNQQLCDRYLDPLFAAGGDDAETALMLACDRAGGWPSEEDAEPNAATFSGITGGGDGAHFPVRYLMPLYVYALAPLFDQKVAQAARGIAPLLPQINPELAAGLARALASLPTTMAAFVRAEDGVGRIEALDEAVTRCLDENPAVAPGLDWSAADAILSQALDRERAAAERAALADEIGLNGKEPDSAAGSDALALAAPDARLADQNARKSMRL